MRRARLALSCEPPPVALGDLAMPLTLARTCLVIVCLFSGSSAWSQESPPLSARIDQLIEAQAGGPLAVAASDAEFQRRLYLDLAGRIPSVEEARAFLSDPHPDKRNQLIDRVLASDDHVRRMSQAFHVMLMERLGDHDEWQRFLHESFKANKPWDQMTRELLCPDPDNELSRGSALWFTKRLENYGQNPVDLPALVRDVGRHFLGIDVQCAQCHDHLSIDDYKQEDYHGLFAFVGHTTLRTDVKFPAVGIKPLEKKAEFISVFVKEPKTVGPKLPGGPEVAIPPLTENDRFEQPPDPAKNFPGVPKFNTLRILSEQLPTAENKAFSRNIANRLWWLLMGRGLVHPLDLHHGGNAPSHPALLDLLAAELVAHQYDMRWLLREIARSQAYQRSSRSDDTSIVDSPLAAYRLSMERPLSSEQLLASVRQATGGAQPLVIPSADKTWTEWQARFDKAFANPPREPEVEYSFSVKAALFVMNDTTVLGWLKPENDNLAARLLKQSDSVLLAEELYLGTLSRQPTDEERQAATLFLAESDREPTASREAAIGQLIWSLLASSEFCSNH
jgi:hypothetical protein